MSLRLKLLLGALLPFGMLLAAGMYSSYQMRTLSGDVRAMLHENERSVTYAAAMYESLERMDSAILLRRSGDEQAFNEIYSAAVAQFDRNLHLARDNITLPGEGELLDGISRRYADFTLAVRADSAELDAEYYWQQISPRFMQLQHNVSELRRLNNAAMYETAHKVADMAARAALPGDLLVLTAMLFAALFAWFMQLYVVNPLRKLQRVLQGWREGGSLEGLTVETSDEIGAIADAFRQLASSRRTTPPS